MISVGFKNTALKLINNLGVSHVALIVYASECMPLNAKCPCTFNLSITF